MKLDKLWRPIDVIGCHVLGRRFIGAENIDDVLLVGESLIKQGFLVTYNLLGEHATDDRSIGMAVWTTNALISKMNFDNSGNISCKPTLFGLAVSKDLFRQKVGPIIEYAHRVGVGVEFDAESSQYIRDTFEVFSSFASVPVLRDSVRQAVQAHLKDIFSLMDQYELWDKNLRIVKGSGVYAEANNLIEKDEALVRAKYFEILRRNIVNRRIPYTATIRDKKLAESVIKVTCDGEYRFEFQMLYGPLGRRLARNLVRRGYMVRIYLPFVAEWCHDVWRPYGLRRAEMIRKIILQNMFGG
ncbi:MAG: hypothetical protein A3B91_01415 [Candidatus Yanofskybacteria bacterium RIFCSPHIGHO2_02_FULL_41_29]|uniref:Proline dehydrogenase domain-containing protein n=1 Tax=Candidatus Yanofskybacteria bacterium RIFCSPHIGHO2_01_FULL_41_53 TaxID=1802663 RepID=A0A1F8EMQ0_9BACT|nr:MAG: hypothetical protein A2650_04700 [Candidatus Yanofskybacteria bacterium RIFCSPHIGHO2_01_FULL_41_53]OGN12435.1 MAG: hypothetical protein A3B91_01415 [Candidatus Yanofskybacteria bacterium RIFCSPHIGHO2_02_FULL_41_29]OGN18681.1 MAG: hypothetical protein A3F48_02545 [Candidatus Yanofskybacteria bacterium RIFCSPHIGHO2_12_FULL_41_9]OGN24414.1 MAG: hypothetical protein A2916_04230 [Candidatus Yanofskybacteria bacterium RIFCSPLOWO2_01_FULL_41_67]OGN28647.1 MAG: hypothetical protein A3H54_01065 